MKNFNAKQSGSEVILEEIRGYYENNEEYYSFTPLILTSIDPNIKVGQVYTDDQLDKGWQYLNYEDEWYDSDEEWCRLYCDKEGVRQVAKLKQPVHEETCDSDDNIQQDGYRLDCLNNGCKLGCPKCPKKQPVHETPKSVHDLETCTEKEEKVTELPALDFTSLYLYVKSVQVAFGLTDDEASTTFYIINMWEMKKVYDPEFKLQNHD